jgi:hypothetical protein
MFQIFLCVQFVLNLFFAPETTYIRDSQYDIDENFEELTKVEHRYDQQPVDEEGRSPVTTVTSAKPIPKKKTFWQEMAIYTGTYTNDNIFKFVLGPFITLLNPAALYSTVTSGLVTAWYVGTAIIAAGIFSAPPYNFGPSGIANVGVGPFIGASIASVLMATTSDPVAKWLTRRNKGV